MRCREERVTRAFLVALSLVASAQPLYAQADLRGPAFARIEEYMRADGFQIIDWRGSRAPGDRTQQVTLLFPDSTVMKVKWANAPRGGGTFNNEPRYERAAFVLQKLFLAEDEYVVPPTILRVFPLEYVRAQVPEIRPTFGNAASSVLVALQYWIPLVTPENFWDKQRAETDTLYARRIGNMNVLTHLIRHADANIGNFLISQVPKDPRVYSVDNGVSFRSVPSNRGFEWRDLRVKRLPAATVERLRRITRADLDAALGVLAEFEIRNGTLVEVAPGENLNPGRGIRQSAERIQLGLTAPEIGDVEGRLRNLLKNVDSGKITTF
jgi:hypothetical protein